MTAKNFVVKNGLTVGNITLSASTGNIVTSNANLGNSVTANYYIGDGGLLSNISLSNVHNGNSILRAIHYPPISSEPASAIRAEQHEDINLITLLVGASAEGLQLLDKNNEWLPITAPEGCIIVNVGDMLQRLTNNKLSSTTHRVVNPRRELWHTHRYSIPFFMHPRSEMDLSCLESCISKEHPLAYEPITAGEYLTERLIEIGLLTK